MSDMDTLIVTFQTQLSDVMEAVVKTAMYEVTRLVEDSFLEELKSRNQEVERLRLQLQWAERKLTEHGEKDGGTAAKCADLSKDDGERPEEPDDILRGTGMKKENEAVESWTKSCRREVKSSLIQEVDAPAATFSPETEPQAKEDDNLMQVVDVKEEAMNPASCSSVCLEGWSITRDGDAGSESHNASEVTEEEAKHSQDTSEELLRNVIKQDLQNYVFPEDQPDTNMSSHSAHISSVEMNTSWAGMNRTSAGLQHNHRLGTEKDQETIQTRAPLNCIEHELSNSATTDAQTQVTSGRDQTSSSGSPKAKLVSIKQEVLAECDGVEEGEQVEKKEMTKSGLASFSCSVKQHKVRADTPKQNRVSHKTTVQEVVKLHSKVGAGLRLQAAIQHLHRPVKKPPNPLSNSTTSALSAAQSQAVNLNPLHRLPSTSKAAPPPPPPPLSIQRIHLGDKQALNRTGAPWVSIKSQHQSANSHTNPVPLPDSHPHPGPRHVLRCGQCGKCFPHPSNLKAHLQTHTGERPFCCSLCGRSFTKLSNLKAHRRVHTGERPYCCMACGKRFTQKCNLKRHQRIHVDV